MRSLVTTTLLLGLFSFNLEAQEPFEPLYAGTLLQFYGENIPPGHISVEPYVYVLRQYGTYNSHWNVVHAPKITSEQWFVFLETGITKWIDFNLIVPSESTQAYGHNSILFSDLEAYLGFQLAKDKKGSWLPDIRLLVGESFPTGKYQNLNPKKQGADISGSGAYETTLILVLDKTYYWLKTHPIALNLNLYYTWLTKVKVHGFNAYGGNADTEGVVKPGNQFEMNLAAEFSLTRNWVVGMDLHYIHFDHSLFHGRPGTGLIPGLPSSEQWSLAPCIEYNFSERFNVSTGAWFSVLGRNAPAFAGGIATIYWYF
ncbi:MAG: hypothetical protein K2P51_06240 [Rhabdochlamydiaceae bacterium]|nr:hypothetical protein [Rhabdochlamydiaceae bacterium]